MPPTNVNQDNELLWVLVLLLLLLLLLLIVLILLIIIVGNSAKTPVPATRNSAASYGIAALIGVTDVRVQ